MTAIKEQNEEPMTFEKVWEMFQETDRKFQETRESQKETDRQMKEMNKESDRKFREMIEETDRQFRAVSKERALEGEKLDKRIKEVTEQLGGMGNSNGAFAEDYFANALSEKKMFAGLQFDELEINMKSKQGALKDEFDIVMYNGTSVALIEVKYKAKKEDLEKMVQKKVSNFRTLFPYYAGHKVYLGIAGMSFNDQVYAKAKELGIGMLKQKGDAIEADTGFVRAY